MIKGIGTDIVEIDRLKQIVDRTNSKFSERILTEYELEKLVEFKDQARYLAKRFAAKEAIAKALGTGIGRGVSWQHIEIFNHPNGAPGARLTGGAAMRLEQLGATSCHLSISDEKHYATALAVLE